jgi:D-alanyl-lipoteichoic acid acyltransferase DltB (MBOAT superfamily)
LIYLCAAEPESVSTLAAWLATVAYALQLLFDFWGYSNMAIGLGWMTGFQLPKNFDYPYVSKSITEFWRRWHMSLSCWFRDYLYVPLGGNREGRARTYRNLLIVFLLCGLWHGAAWTFVAWGAFHGAWLIIERVGWGRVLERLPAPARHVYTMLLVLVGWVLFRAESLGDAGILLSRMFIMLSSAPALPLSELLNRQQGLAAGRRADLLSARRATLDTPLLVDRRAASTSEARTSERLRLRRPGEPRAFRSSRPRDPDGRVQPVHLFPVLGLAA